MGEINRRDFLRLGGITVTMLAIGGIPFTNVLAAETAGNINSLSKGRIHGVLTDISSCIGCKNCQKACQEKNGFSANGDVEDLSPEARTFIKTISLQKDGQEIKRHVRNQCFHCLNPACASACPVKALYKRSDGPVAYDPSKCIGCRYCMFACPFGIPRYEWNDRAPLVVKCIMCFDRLEKGKQPACTEACPMKATIFGPREELIAEAARRINAEPGKYVNHIFGVTEVGGTSWIFISDVPFKELGFKTNVVNKALPEFTWPIMSKVPAIAVGTGVLATAAYNISKEPHHEEGSEEDEI